MLQDLESWDRLQTLFHLAEETSAEERERALLEACSDAALVRRALEIFERSAALESQPAPGTPNFVASRVGAYTLIRLLGAGGIGSVYLAERIVGGAPQRVALKMLAPHAAGPAFIERFHREQHILGSLDHPNITRLTDAGVTEAGQPYLVMEYVDGEHLDVYCDKHKLGLRERLRLFVDACNAVVYAHRNLIVHLDLKPSNILVSQDGLVKLLDFGTSKLIQADSLLTTTVMATPAYSSPEQLRNEPVTTACDVYSLGAILFELLTGKRPFANSSVAAMLERALADQTPDSLLTAVSWEGAQNRGTTEARLRQILAGDLETITQKCLASRPSERYVSAEALSLDVERYLNGEPVLARPQTTLYRLGKFTRRHRPAVAAGISVALLLTGTVSYAFWRQQQAVREARRAIEMQTFMAEVFKLADTNVMGKPAATVPEFLRLWSAVLPRMINDPGDRRAGEISLAKSMFFDSDYEDAETLLGQVISEAKSANDVPAEAEAEGYAGMVAYKLGKIPEFTSLSSHALQLADRRGVTPEVRVWIKTFYTYNRYELDYVTPEDIRIQRAAYKEAHHPKVPPSELAYAANVLALVLNHSSPLAEQRKLAEEALTIYHNEPYGFCEGGTAEETLAFLQLQAGDKLASLETVRNAYQSFKQCRGEDNYETLVAESGVGFALFSNGQTQEAMKLFLSVIERIEKTNGPDSLPMALPLSGLARTYIAMGQYKQAEEVAARLFHVQDGKVNPHYNQVGMNQMIWAQALEGEGRIDEALVHAKIADRDYNANALPGAVTASRRIHDLRLELEAKANQNQ